MNSILQISLGVLTAAGGFVDIGDLVFDSQAGAKYNYSLLWPILVSTLGIILFSEMSGRVTAIAKKPVFVLIKDIYPQKLTIFILIASILLNTLTCAAELGGVAITLQLLIAFAHLPATIIAVALLGIIIWILPFKYLERVMGTLGLLITVFFVAIFFTHVHFQNVLKGFIPTLPQHNLSTFFYFVVGIISAGLMPYEVYFYSSGGIEEHWGPTNLFTNFLTSGVGMTLGGLLSTSLLILGATVLKLKDIIPQLLGTPAMMTATPLGTIGLIIALLGILFTVGGAAVETCLAGAYTVAQYFTWNWGRYKKPEQTPRFTLTWIGILFSAFIISLLGFNPLNLVEYAVIFSVVILPFTYYAIFKVATDKKIMGKYRTKTFGSILSWIYLVIILIIAVTAIPLMITSHMGQK